MDGNQNALLANISGPFATTVPVARFVFFGTTTFLRVVDLAAGLCL
ncbi:MAG: hypothetical protein FJY97_05765 [candidate division Zixibacteria bacterium]|nr:hypothetical protein [candidate division Zixibacteria bacterium]